MSGNCVHFVRGISVEFFHQREFISSLFPFLATRGLPYKLAKSMHDWFHDCIPFSSSTILLCTFLDCGNNKGRHGAIISTGHRRPLSSLVVADLGFPSSWVFGVSFRFLLASSTPATRKRILCPWWELQYCKDLDVVGILRRMEQRHRRGEGEWWQHSPKKSADPLGSFPGLFRHDEYIWICILSWIWKNSPPLPMRWVLSSSMSRSQAAVSQQSTSPLAGIRILVAITSFAFEQLPHLEEVVETYMDFMSPGGVPSRYCHLYDPCISHPPDWFMEYSH